MAVPLVNLSIKDVKMTKNRQKKKKMAILLILGTL